MPFGLRNAGATFQRLMHIALGRQLGRNAEAYVDDIVLKSREARTLVEDLEETFANLGCELVANIHNRDCGHHSSLRSLVGKAFHSGFYWLMALNDATEMVRSCEAWGYDYLYVAIDKFTKWVEVDPVRTIPAGSAVKFIKGLMIHFGVPNPIITDNGSQFTSKLFKTYCANLGTHICYASVAYP
nr:uncharacterized protein LOC109783609 [Aegilops tauschii subsp. strangulata]